MSHSGWIGVDLDGTIAHYTDWLGIEHIGEPIELMLNRVKEWLSQGVEIKIFTARCMTPEAIPYIEAWCLKHIGQVLPVTNVKDFRMIELWDDRAVQVIINTGERVS